MDTKVITAVDLVNGEYRGEADFSGNVEIEAGLGVVRFAKSLKARGFIRAKAGSGISAGWGIFAGRGISAGWGISAGSGISAGWDISAGRDIFAGRGISAGWGISAGSGISAGWGISAGEGISAGWDISAGRDIFAGRGISAGEGISAGSVISAGRGISAGEGISCKLSLIFRYRLFAGISVDSLINDERKTIKCGKLEGPGIVCYGDVIELGLPEDANKATVSAPDSARVEIVRAELERAGEQYNDLAVSIVRALDKA